MLFNHSYSIYWLYHYCYHYSSYTRSTGRDHFVIVLVVIVVNCLMLFRSMDREFIIIVVIVAFSYLLISPLNEYFMPKFRLDCTLGYRDLTMFQLLLIISRIEKLILYYVHKRVCHSSSHKNKNKNSPHFITTNHFK